MWHEPYLESCCRSALHRLVLAGCDGRPGDVSDGPCLARLQLLGLVLRGKDGRFAVTREGEARHDTEILKHPRGA